MTRAEAGRLGHAKAAKTAKRKAEERRSVYAENPNRCPCGTPIPFKNRLRQKFCGCSCSATYNNHQKLKGAKCKVCKEPCNKGFKHCRKCISARLHTRRINSWGAVRTSRTAKRLLIEECGRECFVCHLKEWMGVSIPLDLEHKDGNADNWNKENLALNCPNCHALTPTYKGRNQFHGSARQKKRRERYAAGKTY